MAASGLPLFPLSEADLGTLSKGFPDAFHRFLLLLKTHSCI